MKNRLLLMCIALICFALNGCDENNLVEIQKGCVKGDFEITLARSGKKLITGQSFDLREVDLKANKPPKSDDYLNLYKKRPELKTYNITIKRKATGQTYFGKIAFFKALREAEDEGVCNYYQIGIPDGKFESANDGSLACVYEYYRTKKAEYPTWIVWISDVDIFPKSIEDNQQYN